MDKGGEVGTNYSDTHWLAIDKYWESADRKQAALRFHIQAPYVDFMTGTLSVFILPEHIWSMKSAGQLVDHADPSLPATDPKCWLQDKATAWGNSEPVGSGPFKFVSWVKGQYAKVETWRKHFYHPQPTIDGMVYTIYKTADQGVQALQQGDIDYIAWSIPPSFYADLSRERDIELSQASERGFFYMGYNMRRKSFGYQDNDPLKGDYGKPLRKAIAHCIDKKKIVENLLSNFGIAGDGPISAIDLEWYNNSLPQYSFDPEMAVRILQGAGYNLLDTSKAPSSSNKWKNPDGIAIGSGGQLETLTPPADYDPIRALAGQMIAEQLTNIGIDAKSVALDFGTIVQRINSRDLDAYILGWSIGSDPTDFLYAFFHSDNSESGQNYPGYRNQTFDAIIDHARATGDPIERRADIRNAQAAIAFDQPYNVLYFRTNIEAYRADRFVNWTIGLAGSIFHYNSILGIHAPTKFRLTAQHSVQSPIASNSTTDVTVTVKDQDGTPVEGAKVVLEATNGTLKPAQGETLVNGMFTASFRSPAVPNGADDAKLTISMKACVKEGYDPAPSRVGYMIVKPEGERFMSMRVDVDASVLQVSDVATFTIKVRDQDGNAVEGATIKCELSAAGPSVTEQSLTNPDGVATITFTAPALVEETTDYIVTLMATSDNYPDASQSFPIQVSAPIDPPVVDDIPWALIAASIACVAIAAVATYAYKRRSAKPKKEAK